MFLKFRVYRLWKQVEDYCKRKGNLYKDLDWEYINNLNQDEAKRLLENLKLMKRWIGEMNWYFHGM